MNTVLTVLPVEGNSQTKNIAVRGTAHSCQIVTFLDAVHLPLIIPRAIDRTKSPNMENGIVKAIINSEATGSSVMSCSIR